MSFATWLSVATICALGAASPGPSLALVLRHTLTGSRLAGVACALAHAAGVGLYALATVLGVVALMLRHPELYGAIATAGAAYLGWLGLQLLRRRPRGSRSHARSESDTPWIAARDGLAMALLNPKIAVFFLALFSQFVRPNPGVGEVIILAVTAMTIDAIWYLLVAIALSGSAVPARLWAHGVWLERTTGLVFVAAALWTLQRYWLAA